MESQEKVTDEQAMWRVQADGDPSAFAMLVQKWQVPLHRLAVRMLADPHRAEDVTQETFSRVFTRRHDFQPELRFSTWVWRIAVNLCYDELRRRQRRQESPMDVVLDEQDESGIASGSGCGLSLAADSASPAEHAALADAARRVRGALQELPELYRCVVVLRHYEGLKFSEIAAVLDIPDGTVKSRMVEGLARLAKILGPVLADRPNPQPSAKTRTPRTRATSQSPSQSQSQSQPNSNSNSNSDLQPTRWIPALIVPKSL